MALNPIGNTVQGWNYSKADKPGYSTTLVGTVLAIQEIQKTTYTPGGASNRQPEFWPDGNPKLNIRMALATEDGSIKSFIFAPASKAAKLGQKKSIHMDLFALTGNTDMKKLIGKTISIATQEGTYGAGNPRPWTVSLVEAGPFKPSSELPSEYKVETLLANNGASGGQVQQPQPVQPMQQGNFYAGPMPQAAYVPQQAMPQTQPVAQPVAQVPAGMDPNVAAAMQGAGMNPATATEVKSDPVEGAVYADEDIPF